MQRRAALLLAFLAAMPVLSAAPAGPYPSARTGPGASAGARTSNPRGSMGVVSARGRVTAATGAGWKPALPGRGRAGDDPLSMPEDTRGDADLTRYVNPFGGAGVGQRDYHNGGGGGGTSPAAVAPFGMLQWGPDTSPSNANQGAGYSYGDHLIRGFSLTHASGVGCSLYRDIRFTPTVKPVASSPAPALAGGTAYAAAFSHAHEQAAPGYYAVRLNPDTPSAIGVELAATARSGAGRFTYPAGAGRRATILIDAGGSANGDSAAAVRIDPARREVTGWASSGNFCGQRDKYTVYFAARFNRPFAAHGAWWKGVLLPGTDGAGDATPALYNAGAGAQAGAYVSFDAAASPVALVKVGLSFTGVAAARANLDAEEPPGFAPSAVDTVRRRTEAAWNTLLNRARVGGGSRADTRTFYTMLYHTLLHPNVFGDADGRYLGFDGRVHTAAYTDTATGAAVPYTQYANYSGWDIYRTEAPLLALLAPRQAGDMAQSLVADARESGRLPKWSVANAHTDVMVGDPADPIIADAYAFGATGFDARAALRAMVTGATTPAPVLGGGYTERPALADYLRLGYVPAEDEKWSRAASDPRYTWGTASTTLEYTTADFAVAAFAGALGDRDTRDTFLARSAAWRALFNPASCYIEPRTAAGLFAATGAITGGTGFAEGDSAQYTWMVPYDLRGLSDAMGGADRAAARLRDFLYAPDGRPALDAGPRSAHAYLGNEPSLGAPWAFDWLGQPWRTQGVVRRALLDLYSAAPGGYPGNDDLGTMSAWYVFGALGLYPEVPGAGVLAMGSPLFPHAVLRLAGGDVTIDAPNASDTTPYVRGLTLDGRPYGKPWLTYAALAHGARLRYTLGDKPTRWGSKPADAPPSYAPPGAAPGPTCATAARHQAVTDDGR